MKREGTIAAAAVSASPGPGSTDGTGPPRHCNNAARRGRPPSRAGTNGGAPEKVVGTRRGEHCVRCAVILGAHRDEVTRSLRASFAGSSSHSRTVSRWDGTGRRPPTSHNNIAFVPSWDAQQPPPPLLVRCNVLDSRAFFPPFSRRNRLLSAATYLYYNNMFIAPRNNRLIVPADIIIYCVRVTAFVLVGFVRARGFKRVPYNNHNMILRYHGALRLLDTYIHPYDVINYVIMCFYAVVMI